MYTYTIQQQQSVRNGRLSQADRDNFFNKQRLGRFSKCCADALPSASINRRLVLLHLHFLLKGCEMSCVLYPRAMSPLSKRTHQLRCNCVSTSVSLHCLKVHHVVMGEPRSDGEWLTLEMSFPSTPAKWRKYFSRPPPVFEKTLSITSWLAVEAAAILRRTFCG